MQGSMTWLWTSQGTWGAPRRRPHSVASAAHHLLGTRAPPTQGQAPTRFTSTLRPCSSAPSWRACASVQLTSGPSITYSTNTVRPLRCWYASTAAISLQWGPASGEDTCLSARFCSFSVAAVAFCCSAGERQPSSARRAAVRIHCRYHAGAQDGVGGSGGGYRHRGVTGGGGSKGRCPRLPEEQEQEPSLEGGSSSSSSIAAAATAACRWPESHLSSLKALALGTIVWRSSWVGACSDNARLAIREERTGRGNTSGRMQRQRRANSQARVPS